MIVSYCDGKSHFFSNINFHPPCLTTRYTAWPTPASSQRSITFSRAPPFSPA